MKKKILYVIIIIIVAVFIINNININNYESIAIDKCYKENGFMPEKVSFVEKKQNTEGVGSIDGSPIYRRNIPGSYTYIYKAYSPRDDIEFYLRFQNSGNKYEDNYIRTRFVVDGVNTLTEYINNSFSERIKKVEPEMLYVDSSSVQAKINVYTTDKLEDLFNEEYIKHLVIYGKKIAKSGRYNNAFLIGVYIYYQDGRYIEIYNGDESIRCKQISDDNYDLKYNTKISSYILYKK